MNHDYNELDICRMADTDPREGTPVENIAGFFDSIGWKTTSHADTVKYFESRVDFETFLVSFSEIESPSLLVRRGSLSLLRGRKSNLVWIQQARHPSRRMRWWRSAS